MNLSIYQYLIRMRKTFCICIFCACRCEFPHFCTEIWIMFNLKNNILYTFLSRIYCPHRQLFHFPGLKTVKQNKEMKQNAVGWKNWKKSGINGKTSLESVWLWSKVSLFNSPNPCLHPTKKFGPIASLYQEKRAKLSEPLTRLLPIFNFRWLKNVKQNEEMKQNAVKQLAVGTVCFF